MAVISVPEPITDIEVVNQRSRWVTFNWTEAHNPSNVGLYVLRLFSGEQCMQSIALDESGTVPVSQISY